MCAGSKRKADYLLVDVSNSYTKLAFSTKTRVGSASRIPTKELTPAALEKLLRAAAVNAVVVSSVVPARNATISRAAKQLPLLFIDARCKLGVGVRYPQPKTIGGDRLANA